jgi:mannose-1-phosphate guanylyltransferase
VKAVVLVGGEGTRLRPLTFTVPKQMLPVGGIAMIERVIGWLAGYEIDEAVLSLGYRPDAFLAAYPDGTCCGVTLAYAVEDTPLDTAGAIRYAASSAGVDGTFVVVNGDVLTDLDIGDLVEFHRTRKAAATIALTPVEDPSAFGVVATDGRGMVEAFVEKPAPGEAPSNLINAGTYVLERSVLEAIPRGRRVSIERETFPGLVASRELYALASDASWMDAGTPNTYLAANLRYAAPPGESCAVAPGAEVSNSSLGRSVAIGAGATVDSSVLMDGVVVGYGACVRGSIVGPGAVVAAGACVEDLTVLGEDFVVEPGRVLSGARLPALDDRPR